MKSKTKLKLMKIAYYSSVVVPIFDIIVGVVKGIINGIEAISEEVELAKEKADFENKEEAQILSLEECKKAGCTIFNEEKEL